MNSRVKQVARFVAPQFIVSGWSDRRYQKRRLDKYRRLRYSEQDGYTLEGYDRLQCIYVHIPKNAGISVNRAIFGSRGGGHLKITEYKKIFGRKRFNDYFKFTIVRNPWDRVCSAYHFLRAGGMTDDDRQWAASNLEDYPSFRDFVCCGIQRDEVRHFLHFRSQSDFICENGRIAVDYIGYLETLDEDFTKICRRLGIQAELPRLNVSNARDYREFYDDEMRKIIARSYDEDIHRLGYCFDGKSSLKAWS